MLRAHPSTRACSPAWELLVLSPSMMTASWPRAARTTASVISSGASAVMWASDITRKVSACPSPSGIASCPAAGNAARHRKSSAMELQRARTGRKGGRPLRAGAGKTEKIRFMPGPPWRERSGAERKAAAATGGASYDAGGPDRRSRGKMKESAELTGVPFIRALPASGTAPAGGVPAPARRPGMLLKASAPGKARGSWPRCGPRRRPRPYRAAPFRPSTSGW